MAEESKGLVREQGTARPRSERRTEGRRRSSSVDDGWTREDRDDRDDEADDRPRGRRGRRGRPPLQDELGDLNRGSAFAAAESVALAMDIFSRVLRGVVDRAFDEDYKEPGDVLRGLANEADLAGYDLIDEMRRVPRRLDRRFEEGIRSPRANRGERARRDED